MSRDTKLHFIVDELRIGWGSVVLMQHVSFTIERGTTFALLGGSGCGKSTLLRHLVGLEKPQAGHIGIEGVGAPHLFEGVPRYCQVKGFKADSTPRYGLTAHPRAPRYWGAIR